ncbi:MAG: peptidoglycan DD-metalloendopeptidase family protein [Bacteroidetes bacterium]|jgi:septal ring factor EnvC (AmiA/AmiB activator)|nr:peptidoglycan DD-metalloendopeptidase family protein [Bacteroidota bacterium]
MTRRWHIALLTLLSVTLVTGQRKPTELQRREQELQRLRNEITSFEKKIRDSERRERTTLQRLDDLEEQSKLLAQLLRQLRAEEQQITGDIREARTNIGGLERQVNELTTHYAGWVRSIYMNGRVYDLELLFSSKSLNQLSIRIQYLRRFADQRVRDLQDLSTKKSDLERQNQALQTKLATERQLLAEKTREESRLKRTTSERHAVLRQVRKDKTASSRELSKRTQAVERIEQLIANLIEAERVKKERELEERRKRALADARAPKTTKALPKLPTPEVRPAVAFGDRKGRLRWPVTSGRVQAKFGNVTHPVLKTVTQNTGIDIATGTNSTVYAVADGEVSVLSFIPGFGNVLIINHYDGYRTVYAHLSDVFVAEDQRITEGMEIARSGETVSGSVLHFEIWHEKDKQNPETWLARR